MQSAFWNVAGVVFGGCITLGVAFAAEWLKQPRLAVQIETPPTDAEPYPKGYPATEARFVRVKLYNLMLRSRLLGWLGRDPAMKCRGQIRFCQLDGTPLNMEPMPIRWAEADEPFLPQVTMNGVVGVFDQSRFWSGFRRDVFAGESETIEIARKFDSDEDAYGWTTDNYRSDPQWRNPKWHLPKQRLLVVLTIFYSGREYQEVFRLENKGERAAFHLEDASPRERATAIAAVKRTRV